MGRIESAKLGDYGDGKARVIEFINELFSKSDNTVFLFIGIDDDFKINLVKQFGLKEEYLDRIYTSKGWVDDNDEKLKLMGCLDCLIQPVGSKDLYGLAAIEAMNLKIPIMSCPGELSLCDCSNLETMVDLALKISEGVDLTEFREKIFELAYMRFSVDSNMLKYLELLK